MAFSHPVKSKRCVLCNCRMGNANLKFIIPNMGYGFDVNVERRRDKTNSRSSSFHFADRCKFYESSLDAEGHYRVVRFFRDYKSDITVMMLHRKSKG
jgi:hypothetical protein